MTKNEQIASIMLEAAELLKNDTMNESAGANGLIRRSLEERLKNPKLMVCGRPLNDSDKSLYNYVLKCKKNDYAKARQGDKEANEFNAKMSKQDIDDYDTLTRTVKKDGWKLPASEKNPGIHYPNYPLHDKINKRAALKEAIDLLYEKAAEVDTMDEAVELIDRAEALESLLED